METGRTLKTTAELEIVRNIKEEMCYVALDYEKELEEFEKSGDKDVVFELPDGE